MSQDEHYAQAARIVECLTGYNLWGTHRINDIEFLADILRHWDQVNHATTVELDQARARILALERENLKHPLTRALDCTWTYLAFLCGLRDEPGHTVHSLRVG